LSNLADTSAGRVQPHSESNRPLEYGRVRVASARTAIDRVIEVRIVVASIGFRIVSAFLAMCVNIVFPLDHPLPNQSSVWGNPSPFWDAFARHDSGWYFDIARNGYDATNAVLGGRSNIAFAPVYPMLMRYVGRLFGRAPGDVYLGGIVVSWVCFSLAMVVLYRLASLDLPRRQAQRAVLLTAIFPFSFFFGAVYTESTFLLFALLAFYGFRTGRWALGGLAGAIAGATRVTGILMWPALAWIAWQTARPVSRDRAGAAVGLIVATLGFAGYCAYIYDLTGQPLLWATALTRWGGGYHPGGAPWSAPAELVRRLLTHPYAFLSSEPMAVYDALYGVTALLFVAAIPFVWRKLGAAYGVFMLLNLYVPLSSGAFEGLGRYCSVLFPAFIWLAWIRSRFVYTSLVVIFALFYTLGLALFTTVRPLF
jgi:Mannosyltransferase (PIG-V)